MTTTRSAGATLGYPQLRDAIVTRASSGYRPSPAGRTGSTLLPPGVASTGLDRSPTQEPTSTLGKPVTIARAARSASCCGYRFLVLVTRGAPRYWRSPQNPGQSAGMTSPAIPASRSAVVVQGQGAGTPVSIRGAACDPERSWLEGTLHIPVALPQSAGAARLLRLMAGDLAVSDLAIQRDERHHPTLWIAWATLDQPEGGGLAACVGELGALDEDDLDDGAVEFLTWLATGVDTDHPLVSGRREWGHRSRSSPLRPAGVGHQARAYRAWREAIDRPTHWTERDLTRMADLSGATKPRRRAEFTVDTLAACLEVLDEGQVVSISDPVRSGAWHARERAALLVRVWGVLRAGEAVQLGSGLEVTPFGLRVRLLEPKTGRSRWVKLTARGDRYCPVLALAAWLSAARAAGYDLGGRLLPTVRHHRLAGSAIGAGSATEKANFLLIVERAGLSDQLGVYDDDVIVGLHNLRSVLPTLAVDAGHDLPFLQGLAAWARGATPGERYVASRDGFEEAQAMADVGFAA
jgi:hypothetical protein